ncbi:MAG: 4-demethylwyosine synthase TYW1 [Thaumarchaeota archaeon]|nr:MAG: 4-demethylwyosine synthase TYW1 [Nitrososphaerota archaeon]
MSCSDEHVSHSTDNLIQITPQLKARLQKAKYGVYNHSAVELCHWTRKSFANEGNCYKHKFYGISTHQCMEMTPAAMNCENRCIYCWRPTEFYDTLEMPEELVDEPDVIVEQLMAERKKLINGYYGNTKNDKRKLDESLLPAHYAISLSGEPTMYPKLPKLIKYLKSLKATKSIFLVTNGQEPDMLRRLVAENGLPTQATVNTRTVLRMTLIRGYNDSKNFVGEFGEMMAKGNPHFIELKSYMHIGMSNRRLEQDHMLEMQEVRDFAVQLCEKMSSFKMMDESEVSRIVVLQNQARYTDRWIKEYIMPAS